MIHLLLMVYLVMFTSGPNWLKWDAWVREAEAKPNVTLMYFITPECMYCKKMEREVFPKPEVMKLLNTFHLMKMDATQKEEIHFAGEIFRNRGFEAPQEHIHDLAYRLAAVDGVFGAPTLILLDEQLNIIGKRVGYQSAKELQQWIRASTSAK